MPHGPNHLTITALIPTLNEAEHLADCMTAARHAGIDEIVVCDGNSSDQTLAIARQHGADAIVQSEVGGRGVQLKCGWPHANGDFVMILHADNRLDPDALASVAQTIAANAGQPFWGGFRQRIDNSRAIYRWIERGNATRVRYRGVVFGDQAMIVHRDWLQKIGGPPSVAMMEDVIISNKLKKLARPILFDGLVVVEARRWQQNGVVRQTAKNWTIQLAHACGVGPSRLRKWYQPHQP